MVNRPAMRRSFRWAERRHVRTSELTVQEEKPGINEGVGLAAEGQCAVQALVVEAVAVAAGALYRGVSPKGGIVCVPKAGLQPKEPLVPRQSPEVQGAPGQAVETLVGM